MYREEHPNPQFFRNDWINLNGQWDFEFDFGCSGRERKMYEADGFEKKINVPFCPESKLSGIEYKDFMNGVWYMRKFSLPCGWNKGRVFIHFGAVDYCATVYINKKEAGVHKGGYSSFSFDITDFLEEGENTVCVYAEDSNKVGKYGRGKQAHVYYSSGCDYTRTTGIWQTVWLEHTPENYIKNFKIYPDPENGKVSFDVETSGSGEVGAEITFDGKKVGEFAVKSIGTVVHAEAELSEIHLWELGRGNLYDVELSFGGDAVKTYFGLRSVCLDGMKFMLNGKSVFQRLVLDQGFYRDGIYTAPTKEELERDIILSMEAGFNGARLHQKVFEPLFLYYCDKHGYIVWGEYANWGIDYSDAAGIPDFLSEWREEIERDFNHPSIIGWCPFNETWDFEGKRQNDGFLSTAYYFTKSVDKTRPCIDTSGNFHVVTDIFDIHDYSEPDGIKEHFDGIETGDFGYNFKDRQKYKKGQPVFVSEYGGIKSFDDNAGWGYGSAPKTEEEFVRRYKDTTENILNNPNIMGFCYTQLYDIEQEINGLYTYDREPKTDMEKIKNINTAKAAIE